MGQIYAQFLICAILIYGTEGYGRNMAQGPATQHCVMFKNWNCTVFFNETPRGDRLSICPFEMGTRLAGLLVARNNVQCCSSINQISVICHPVFAGKCIAVTLACVGLAAKLKVIQRQAIFSTKHRVECTCVPCGFVIVKFTYAIARVLEQIKVWGEGGDFWSERYSSFCRLSSRS
jgi:hypothetical protein